MSARQPRFNAEQVLERIWSNSGEEEDFEIDESEIELYGTASEDESDESSVDVSSASEENIALDSDESSDDEASDGGDVGNQMNRARQRTVRQQQALLVWRMARETTSRDIPFTGNSGVQVHAAGFEPYDYFSLFSNDDLLNCFVAKTNCYADKFIAEGNLRRRSRANDWSPTDKK